MRLLLLCHLFYAHDYRLLWHSLSDISHATNELFEVQLGSLLDSLPLLFLSLYSAFTLLLLSRDGLLTDRIDWLHVICILIGLLLLSSHAA